MSKKRVFLGGTCNGSQWRDKMEEYLAADGLDYFNLVVEDWNEEAQANELREREECDFCLYVITPKMVGVYAIAEVVDDSNKRPGKTVFVILQKDDHERFLNFEWKSLRAVADLVERNGGAVFEDLKPVSVFIKAFAALETK